MKKSILIVALAVLAGPLVHAAARQSQNEEATIKIPAAKAAKMVNALGKVVKAPRPDAAQPCTPEYPVGSLCSDDLDALKDCICLINEQLAIIISQLDILDLGALSELDVIVSQLDQINILEVTIASNVDQLASCVGCACESGSESIDFCDRTSTANIDNSNATVIGYLRTILRELRGLVGEADYCLPCTPEVCSVTDLPAGLLCPVVPE